MDKPLWAPTPERISESNISRLIQTLKDEGHQGLADFESLHRFSVAQPDAFWSHVWDHCGVVGDKGSVAFAPPTDGDLRTARFFPDARLNFAETVIAGLDPTASDIMVFRAEDKVERRVSRADLITSVARVRSFLTDMGVAPGDRVSAMLPNMPEAIMSVLGTAAAGAIWASCSPDFGAQGVIDRFGQIEPKVLFVCDGYYYAGKTIDVSDKAADVIARLPSLTQVVVVPLIGRAEETVAALRSAAGPDGPAIATWADAIDSQPAAQPTYEAMPFAAPLYILFSSGTTGVPKCIVHSAGGTLLKHLTEQRFHTDVTPGDRLFYFTTLGWMMWNWLVTCLGSGARLMLYDGSPFHPNGNVLWDYAQAERFTQFGTSAKYIDALKKAGFAPARTHDLSDLRCLLSTGSPLVPESFDYIYASLKTDLHVASISGGTDIVGCFVLGDPTGAVWRGEIQAKALGLAPDVVDVSGQPLASGKGELVCRNAFPSMPVGFWNDPDGNRYEAAYFARFPGLWHHGDFAEWTAHGGMVIHGRSDATLNPGGVRIGTAEIYRQVEQLDEVVESIVIGQEWDGDVRVVLFVVLKDGATLDEALTQRIKTRIREGASPRHVPARVVAVADIPRTKSGKITEIAVRDVVHGRPVNNKEALANPDALELFADLDALKS